MVQSLMSFSPLRGSPKQIREWCHFPGGETLRVRFKALGSSEWDYVVIDCAPSLNTVTQKCPDFCRSSGDSSDNGPVLPYPALLLCSPKQK